VSGAWHRSQEAVALATLNCPRWGSPWHDSQATGAPEKRSRPRGVPASTFLWHSTQAGFAWPPARGKRVCP